MFEDLVSAIWDFLVDHLWFRCCAAATVVAVTVQVGSWSHWLTWAIVALAVTLTGIPYLLIRSALRGKR